MKQAVWRQNIHLRDHEVIEDILICRIKVGFRKANRIGAILVDGGIKGREINIRNVFPFLSFSVQHGVTCPSPKGGLAWIHQPYDLECFRNS